MKREREQIAFDAWPEVKAIVKKWREQGMIQGIQINLAIKTFDALLQRQRADAKKRSPK